MCTASRTRRTWAGAGSLLLLLLGTVVKALSTDYRQLTRAGAINELVVHVTSAGDDAARALDDSLVRIGRNYPPAVIDVYTPAQVATLMGMWPETLQLYKCFTDTSVRGREWRKYDDTIEDDKMCRDPIHKEPFAFNMTTRFIWMPAEDTCHCTLSICAFVLCAGDTVCHVACASDPLGAGPPRLSGRNPVRAGLVEILAFNTLEPPLWLAIVGWSLVPLGPAILAAFLCGPCRQPGEPATYPLCPIDVLTGTDADPAADDSVTRWRHAVSIDRDSEPGRLPPVDEASSCTSSRVETLPRPESISGAASAAQWALATGMFPSASLRDSAASNAGKLSTGGTRTTSTP